jgi:hypothetical protein
MYQQKNNFMSNYRPSGLEIRRYWITEHLDILPETKKWQGLHRIGRVERVGWRDKPATVECH